jgi:hypothetical protein
MFKLGDKITHKYYLDVTYEIVFCKNGWFTLEWGTDNGYEYKSVPAHSIDEKYVIYNPPLKVGDKIMEIKNYDKFIYEVINKFEHKNIKYAVLYSAHYNHLSTFSEYILKEWVRVND